MQTEIGLERCRTFIDCQLKPAVGNGFHSHEIGERPAITLSRQAGSGAHAIAEMLVPLLQSQEPDSSCPWTVFDRNLVEKVLADHHLPERLARFMPEDRISEISDTMDELFGLHPPSWSLVHKTAETILRLAELGNVILIGRGANVITSKMERVLHVRLIAPLDQRIQYLAYEHQLNTRDARDLLHREDLGRRRYLRKYFDKDAEDPLLYHLVINTGLVSLEEAARLIADAVSKKVACQAAD